MNNTILLCCPIFEAGESLMARAGMHPRIKIVQAWVQIGDNSSKNQTFEIIGISKLLNIKNGHSSGFIINIMPYILQHDISDSTDIIVKTNNLQDVGCKSIMRGL